MTPEEFHEALALGHEQEHIEFKGPGRCVRGPLVTKVVRAMMGMANRSGGGRVIIGVEDIGNSLTSKPCSPEELASWTHDVLSDQVSRYADPSIDFEVGTFDVDGASFVEIRVQEFRDVPIVCKKEYHDGKSNDQILKRGGCYVRTRGKAETSDISTHEDMRILIDLATDKGVRRFLERSSKAGLLTMLSTPMSQEQLNRVASEPAYADELQQFLEQPLVHEVQSRGYWQVVIRPISYSAVRVSAMRQLREAIQRAHVSVRGWSFPPVGVGDQPTTGENWVGDQVDWEHNRELWRICQSAQFMFLGGLSEDWRDRSQWRPAGQSWEPGAILPIMDTVFSLTEFFEFAAKLALSPASDESVFIEITLGNAKDRLLTMDSPTRAGFYSEYRTAADSITFSKTVSRADLIAMPKKHAVDAVLYFVDRFGWDATPEQVESMQNEWIRR